MRVSATRLVTTYALAGVFFVALFVGVVILQGAVNAGLRAAGLGPSAALTASGAIIFAGVMGVTGLANAGVAMARARLRAKARGLNLPEYPTCVIWRGGDEAEMPWVLVTPIEVHFPKIARQLGVEGVAVVDFEIGADGKAKNLHCIDVWPARLFYDSAASALRATEFALRNEARPRAGVTYRMPFVFRINGHARVTDRGRKARKGRSAR
jgi:TonB family protein